MDSSRLSGLMTGFITIAATIMVLELKVPVDSTLASLAQEWPTFLSHVNSFFTILLLWFNHVTLLKKYAYVSIQIVILDLIWILFVLVIPLATGWVASYPNGFYPELIYVALLLLCYLLFHGIDVQLLIEGLITKEDFLKTVKVRLPIYIGLVIALITVFFSPILCIALVLLTVLYNFVFLYRTLHRIRTSVSSPDGSIQEAGNHQ